MALNSNTNQNENRKSQEKEFYSRFKLYNSESSLDPSTTSISYWAGFMKLSVAPLIPESIANGGTPKYDYDNKGVIYLNHINAYMLAREIELLLAGNFNGTNLGVKTANDTFLSVSTGVEYGITLPCLVLRRVGEDGSILYTYIYEINSGYFSVRNFNGESGEYDKFYYANVELEMFKQTLDTYAATMGGATGYEVADTLRFTTNKVDQIAEQLGVGKRQQRHSSGVPGRQPSSSIMGSVDSDVPNMLSASDIEEFM